MPAPKTAQVEPGSTLAVNIAAPRPVERPHANRQARSSGASGETLASAISRQHRVLGEGRGAHEVADRLAVARKPGGPVGEVTEILLLADRQAEIGLGAAAVNALAALGREQRDDVIAGRDQLRRPRRPARRRPRPRARAPSAHSRRGPRRRPCRDRCGRRRRPRGARAPRRRRGSASSTSWTSSGAPNSSSTAARICMLIPRRRFAQGSHLGEIEATRRRPTTRSSRRRASSFRNARSERLK